MKKIESREDFDQMIQNNSNVLVDFSASWCGPCKVLLPQLEEAERFIKENESDVLVEFAKIDVDQDEIKEIVSSYFIRNVPTVILFSNGTEKVKFVGAKSKNQIVDFIKSNLN